MKMIIMKMKRNALLGVHIICILHQKYVLMNLIAAIITYYTMIFNVNALMTVLKLMAQYINSRSMVELDVLLAQSVHNMVFLQIRKLINVLTLVLVDTIQKMKITL